MSEQLKTRWRMDIYVPCVMSNNRDQVHPLSITAGHEPGEGSRIINVACACDPTDESIESIRLLNGVNNLQEAPTTCIDFKDQVVQTVTGNLALENLDHRLKTLSVRDAILMARSVREDRCAEHLRQDPYESQFFYGLIKRYMTELSTGFVVWPLNKYRLELHDTIGNTLARWTNGKWYVSKESTLEYVARRAYSIARRRCDVCGLSFDKKVRHERTNSHLKKFTARFYQVLKSTTVKGQKIVRVEGKDSLLPKKGRKKYSLSDWGIYMCQPGV